MKKNNTTLVALGAVALAAASLLSACVKENPDSPGFEYMPDMYRSPSVETNGVSFRDTIWVDGKPVKDTLHMGNMLPPAGTVPRGFTPFPYENTPQGDSLASQFWKNPLPHNDQTEEEGKFLYQRFCVYCHGEAGDGQGPLVKSGKYGANPPNYKQKYEEGVLTDGHVYFVITYGRNAMGSHASQLSPEERWKVVQYVQRLGRGKPWSQSPGLGAPAVQDTAKAAGGPNAANAKKPQ